MVRKISINRGRALKVIIVVFLMLFASNTVMAEDTDGVYVSVNSPSDVAKDSDFSATVDISNLVNFDAGQFDVRFDSKVLRLDKVTDGLIGDTVVPADILREIWAGRTRVLMNVTGTPGISGSGYLAVLHFHAVGDAGKSSDITLSDGFINSNQAVQIVVEEWDDSSVTIVNSGGFPFSIILWIVIGIIGLLLIYKVLRFLLKRRKQRSFLKRYPYLS